MAKKYLIILCIINILIGFAIGLIFSQKFRSATKIKANDQNNTFAAGWKAAEKRLEETGAYFFQNKKLPIKTISGSVDKIENNKIYLKVPPLSPLADKELDERIIKIDSNTTIYKVVKKPEDQYRKELEKFYQAHPEALNDAGLQVPPPSRVYSVEAKFNEIKVGQVLLVEADKDISKEKIIIAKKITIQ